jgi:uncharacterized protein (DUF2336 family)
MSESLVAEPTEADALVLSTALRARAFVIQRLSDLVCWPSTRLPWHERQLAADALIGLLRTADAATRARCAKRIAALAEAPKILLRYLARDDINVSRPILEESPSLDDSDLIATIRAGTRAHWLAIGTRRRLAEQVAETLIRTGDAAVAEAVLKNPGARLSVAAVDAAVLQSRDTPQLTRAIAAREEATPAQALTMFWWSDHETRLQILRRFAVDRAVLMVDLQDLFSMAIEERNADAEVARVVALLERRQRNRPAAEASVHRSLEGAIEAAAENGLNQTFVDEISLLAGIQPSTGVKIFTDRGGEGLAVLCKATGLRRPYLQLLWRAQRRALEREDDSTSPFRRIMFVFDLLATAKAQTVLRYWNWSLALGPSAETAPVDPDAAEFEFLPARRNAALIFGRRG